jgi:hypothetical protein
MQPPHPEDYKSLRCAEKYNIVQKLQFMLQLNILALIHEPQLKLSLITLSKQQTSAPFPLMFFTLERRAKTILTLIYERVLLEMRCRKSNLLLQKRSL